MATNTATPAASRELLLCGRAERAFRSTIQFDPAQRVEECAPPSVSGRQAGLEWHATGTHRPHAKPRPRTPVGSRLSARVEHHLSFIKHHPNPLIPSHRSCRPGAAQSSSMPRSLHTATSSGCFSLSTPSFFKLGAAPSFRAAASALQPLTPIFDSVEIERLEPRHCPLLAVRVRS